MIKFVLTLAAAAFGLASTLTAVFDETIERVEVVTIEGEKAEREKIERRRITKVGWIAFTLLFLAFVCGGAKEWIANKEDNKRDREARIEKAATISDRDQQAVRAQTTATTLSNEATQLKQAQNDLTEAKAKVTKNQAEVESVHRTLNTTSEALDLQSQASVIGSFDNKNIKVKSVSVEFLLKKGGQKPKSSADLFLPRFPPSECKTHAQVELLLILTDSQFESAIFRHGTGFPGDDNYWATRDVTNLKFGTLEPDDWAMVRHSSKGFEVMEMRGDTYDIDLNLADLKIPAAAFYSMMLITRDARLKPGQMLGSLDILAEWGKPYKDRKDLSLATEQMFKDEYPNVPSGGRDEYYKKYEDLLTVKTLREPDGSPSIPTNCLDPMRKHWLEIFDSAVLTVELDDPDGETLLIPLKRGDMTALGKLPVLPFLMAGPPILRTLPDENGRSLDDLVQYKAKKK